MPPELSSSSRPGAPGRGRSYQTLPLAPLRQRLATLQPIATCPLAAQTGPQRSTPACAGFPAREATKERSAGRRPPSAAARPGPGASPRPALSGPLHRPAPCGRTHETPSQRPPTREALWELEFSTPSRAFPAAAGELQLPACPARAPSASAAAGRGWGRGAVSCAWGDKRRAGGWG